MDALVMPFLRMLNQPPPEAITSVRETDRSDPA